MSKPFLESDRYEYNLNSASIVMDCGAHKGAFAEGIVNKYKCRVYAFEPVRKWADDLVVKFANHPTVSVFDFGIAATTRKEKFFVNGDSSSIFNESDEQIEVQFVDWGGFMLSRMLNNVDLLKLNVEGMEYEILEDIIEMRASRVFKNIQVQFHMNVPDFEARHARIRDSLLRTHELTMDFPFVWENFKCKQ